jgi:hypothetical protein
MIGAGIGLLVAERLSNDKRRAIAWTLITVGALTSIPLGALALFGVDRRESANGPGRCTRARAMSH